MAAAVVILECGREAAMTQTERVPRPRGRRPGEIGTAVDGKEVKWGYLAADCSKRRQRVVSGDR